MQIVSALPKMSAFALIIAGGLGNIIDRLLFDRHVSDFMNIGIQNIRTGIFNFADVCVTAGAIVRACYLYIIKQTPIFISSIKTIFQKLKYNT